MYSSYSYCAHLSRMLLCRSSTGLWLALSSFIIVFLFMAKMWFDVVRGHTIQIPVSTSQIDEPMAQIQIPEPEDSSRNMDDPPSYTSIQFEAPHQHMRAKLFPNKTRKFCIFSQPLPYYIWKKPNFAPFMEDSK